MSASHVVSVFLRNVTDTDFQTAVTYCLNSNADLDDCVSAIRKLERDIQQKKIARHRLKSTLWRMTGKKDQSDDYDSMEPTPKRLKNNKSRRVDVTQGKSEN
jgi:hypothetical protein